MKIVSSSAKNNLRNWRKTPRAIENVVNEPNTVEPSFPITSRSHVSLYPHNSRKGPSVQCTESLWNQHFSRNLLLELYFRVARWKLWGIYPIVSDILKRKLEQLAVRWDYHIATGQLWLLALTFRPHVHFIPENGSFSSCLAYCNWVSGKKKVTITSFRVEIFKNIGFPWTCGRTKKEVVVPVYGSWIIYILLPLTTLSYFHRFFAFYVDRRKRFQYATCGRVFFFATKKEEKNIRF